MNAAQISDEKRDEKIVPYPIEKEMKHSYIDYAMSVIVGRALPDARDGLKPVHRRILYAMNELGLTADRPYKKSARIVGDTLGRYHPHGDIAIYDALTRMAQDFSLRYPLIDGQGNFGSVDGDAPAAMRYTEARLAKIAEEMLADIDKDTVEFVDNFDGTLNEPVVLPARLPNLLINGSSGIAVGMATNIPPHNLSEIIDGLIFMIDNPNAEVQDLMNIIRGPDFPTGGIIYGIAGILEAYASGKGVIQIRAKTRIETAEKEKKRIIVTELPYMVNKSELLTTIAELVKDKRIDGITDLRDESDREGLRIVIELRRDVTEDVVLNQLFAHTQLQSSFGIINLALVNNQPKLLTLKDMLQLFIEHRVEVVTRRSRFELLKAEERLHILQGLMIAFDNIDELIRIVRKSKRVEEAKTALINRFLLTEEQAKAILEMRLQKLTGMEMEALRREFGEVTKQINYLRELLASRQKILELIKSELLELAKNYGDMRRTQIVAQVTEVELEDLIPVVDQVVTITHAGYIKRLPMESYRAQKRGGKGLIGMEPKEEDFVVNAFVSSTHDYILFFTNHGKCYWLKTYKLPEESRYSKGKPLINLLPRLEKDEKINATIPVKEFDPKSFVIFATKKGVIKKTWLSAFSNPRIVGIRAIELDAGDEVIDTKLSSGEDEIVLATRLGKAVRFSEKLVRPMGRTARGMRGIKLRSGDEVVSMALVKSDSVLLTITEHGFGKRSPISLYRKTRRGAQGVITAKITDKNGAVVAVKEVSDTDELIVTSRHGMVIRIPVHGIRLTGRAAVGVKIMKLNEGDSVIAVTRLAGEPETKAPETRGKPEHPDTKTIT